MAGLAKRSSGALGSLWDPFRELEAMSSRLNQLFRPGMDSGEREALAGVDWAPSVNISETEAAYVIRADLPGVTKENITVHVENGVLSLRGERQHREEQKNEKFHRVESSYGSFLRRFTLPDDVREDDVNAEMKDGCLEVTMPKSGEKKPKARSIEVH
jgi:HSP20 family protein